MKNRFVFGLVVFVLLVLCFYSVAASKAKSLYPVKSISDTIPETDSIYLTTQGTVRALFVFIDYSDDTVDINNPTWPVGIGPNYLNDIVDSTETQNSGKLANVTTYFKDMSFGKFTMIGKAYYQQAPHPLSWYDANQKSLESQWTTTEVLNSLDQKIDFAQFDLWINDGNIIHKKGADGVLDVVVICYRRWYLGINSSFKGEGWSTQDIFSSNFMKVDNGLRSIYANQGVVATNMIEFPRFEHLVHEIGHLWNLPHNYGTGVWALMGHRSSNVSSFMNSYERHLIGWGQIIDVRSDYEIDTIPDYGMSGIAYRISIPETNNKEYYLFENHQNISPYDVVDITGGAGLYILHYYKIEELFNEDFKMRLVNADGRYNWTVPDWIQNPWGNGSNPNDIIPVFKRGAINRLAGVTDRGVINIQNSDNVNGQNFIINAWLDEQTGRLRTEPRWMGDGKDGYTVERNNIFSPWSASASSTWDGNQTTIGSEIISNHSTKTIVKFYLTNPLNGPPSTPQDLQVNWTADNAVSLTWTANIEPDVIAGGGYNVYRAVYYDGAALSYIRLNSSLITSTIFIDTLKIPSSVPQGKTLYLRYYIQAVDNTNKTSVPSDECTLNINSFFINLTQAISVDFSEVGYFKVNGLKVGAVWRGNMQNGQSITLEAGEPQTGEYFFLRWSDSTTENPRTIVINSNVNLSAIYKVHLASSNSSPTTSANGQQRFVSSICTNHNHLNDTIYNHLVYETGGEIWYTNYNSSIMKWSREVCLSDGSGKNTSPSIASSGIFHNQYNFSGNAGIHVVWQKQNAPNSYEVYWKSKYDISDAWSSSGISDVVGTTAVPPSPSIKARTGADSIERITIAYLDKRTDPYNRSAEKPNEILLKTVKRTANGWSRNSDSIVIWNYGKPIDDLAISPSNDYNISKFLSADTTTLCYSRLDSTGSECAGYRLITEDISNIDNYQSSAQIIVPASNDIPLTNNSSLTGKYKRTTGIFSPQVFRVDGKVRFAWIERQAFEGSDPIMFAVYQDRNSNNIWSNAVAWDLSESGMMTSLSMAMYKGETVVMMGTEDSIWIAQTKKASWQSPIQVCSNGYAPVIATLGGYSISAQGDYIYTQNNQVNRSILLNTLSSLPGAESAKEQKYSRLLLIDNLKDSSSLQILVSEPKHKYLLYGSFHFEQKYISFSEINDENNNITSNNFLNCISTKPILIDTRWDTLCIALSFNGRKLKTIQNLYLFLEIDGKLNNSSQLTTLTITPEKPFSEVFLKVALFNYEGKSLRLKVSGTFLDTLGEGELKFNLLHLYGINRINNDESKATQYARLVVPYSVNLLQNYPNPFNSSTIIEYGLPAYCHVTLKIYDILGREVAVLQDEEKSSGYHSVLFDATMFSSGVYFSRLAVKPERGATIVNIKKMLLIK